MMSNPKTFENGLVIFLADVDLECQFFQSDRYRYMHLVMSPFKSRPHAEAKKNMFTRKSSKMSNFSCFWKSTQDYVNLWAFPEIWKVNFELISFLLEDISFRFEDIFWRQKFVSRKKLCYMKIYLWRYLPFLEINLCPKIYLCENSPKWRYIRDIMKI